MKKTGILNSEIAKIISEMGHTDKIVICDCGLPIPSNVKRIDLSLKIGEPKFTEVLEELLIHLEVDNAFLAKEIKEKNIEVYKETQELLQPIEVRFISHEEFKEISKTAKAIIRTGEITPYANIILESGVIF